MKQKHMQIIGIVMIGAAIILAIPGIFRKERKEEQEIVATEETTWTQLDTLPNVESDGEETVTWQTVLTTTESEIVTTSAPRDYVDTPVDQYSVQIIDKENLMDQDTLDRLKAYIYVFCVDRELGDVPETVTIEQNIGGQSTFIGTFHFKASTEEYKVNILVDGDKIELFPFITENKTTEELKSDDTSNLYIMMANIYLQSITTATDGDQKIQADWIRAHDNGVIILNEESIKEDQTGFFDTITDMSGQTVPNLHYTEEGAAFYSIEIRDEAYHIYIGTKEEPKKWIIYPTNEASDIYKQTNAPDTDASQTEPTH